MLWRHPIHYNQPLTMLRPILILLFSFFGTRIFSQDAKLIYKNAVNSTVTIETDKGLGSGFFVGKNIIATNYHVMEGATIAYCYTNSSDTKYNIEGFLAADTSTDLILLEVSGLNRPPLKMASKSVVTGQKIFVLGSPKGLPATISDGLVSGLRNFNGYKLIQITAPISPGSSGGPVLNSNGELVGVSVGQINSGQNLNFAIPKSYLQLLLNSKKSKPVLLVQQPIKASSSNQTKIETQDWIKEKIENFTHDFHESALSESGTQKYEVEYGDCKIIIKKKRDATTQNPFNANEPREKVFFYQTYEIPVKELSRLSITKDNQTTHIILKIKSNETIIKYTSESTYGKYELKNENVNIVTLYIPNNLLEESLPERLTKAFDKLIELCGGKVTKEIF